MILEGGKTYDIGMIRSMQVVLHLPLFRILFPANVCTFHEIILPFVMFEFLEPEHSSRLILSFDDDNNQHEMFDQMADLGYETHNSILNLGSIFVF